MARSLKIVLLFVLFVNGGLKSQDIQQREIEQLYDRAWDYLEKDIDSSLYYSQQLFDHSRDKNYKLGIVKSYYASGHAYFKLNQFDNASLKFFQGINYIQKNDLTSKVYKERELKLFQSIGSIYDLTYGFDEAINFFNKALDIANQINSASHIAVLNYNIGLTYYKLDDYNQAEDHLNIALQLYEELGDQGSLAETYNLFGILRKRQQKFREAQKYFLQALRISNDNSVYDEKRSWYVSNLGGTYLEQDQFDSAKYFYNQALLISQKLNDTERLKWLNNNLGDVYLKEKDWYRAIEFYKKSMEFSHQGSFDYEFMRSSKNISEAYEGLGDFQKAFSFNDLYLQQVESLQGAKEKLTEQNAKYRMKEVEWILEKQAKELQLASMERENSWFKISMSILTIVFAFVAYKAVKFYKGIKQVKNWLATD